MLNYDYIIVGSGLAGLYTAFRASAYGKVALLTKSGIRESNSYFAQGGIAVVTGKDDDPAFHFEDTIIAGRGLCDYPAVSVLVNEGPERIKELIQQGMIFDTENGELALGLEGGHHQNRILHAGGDATGKVITNFLIEKVEQIPTIEIFDNHAIIDILKDPEGCYGVRCWDFKSESEKIFIGQNTFLTSGGASAIFKRTTNPNTTVGDGLAISYKAGCEIADIEFIQFHPSSLYSPTGETYLISEAVRGEGAHLLNQKGERFMLNKHELAELAPRDIVAKSIFEQMLKNNEEYVFLSLKHLEPERIKKRFPNIFEKCKELGYDMTDKIPVAPAAHYTVGGVKTDLNGRSAIPHLYICGELASSGIMGANRLASNSLIECLVFGNRAVEDSQKSNKRKVFPETKPIYRFDKTKQQDYLYTKNIVANIMTTAAGIIRTEEKLQNGLEKVIDIRFNSDFQENEYYSHIKDNLLTVAELIIRSALYRKESRGGHFREDYPEMDDGFKCHIIQKCGRNIQKIEVDTSKI